MIVIDVGCYGHGMYDSIGSLITKFAPQLVLGFDPLTEDKVAGYNGATIITRKAAAWTRYGEVLFTAAGTQSTIGGDPAQPSTQPIQPSEMVPCFDLASLIQALPGEVVLKIDAEGAEIPILRHLHRKGADARLSLLLVEEHPHLPTYTKLPKMSCPVEEWWM